MKSENVKDLESFIGRRGETVTSPDPVNEAMIRQWCAALGDRNPAYLDEGVAPPAMLQAWTMPGYGASKPADAVAELYAALDEMGYASIVATDSEQEYVRSVRVGDVLSATKTIASISEEKSTKLGRGVFVTVTVEVVDQSGVLVGRQLYRTFKFRPREQPDAGARRPHPVTTQDTAFFFEAANEGRLVIQRCTACGRLQHPPTAACPQCGSLELDAVEAAGRGTLFSFTVVHAGATPGLETPYVVGLVELEEGTRLVAQLVEIEPDDAAIGMSLEVDFLECDPELTLPVFRPALTRSAS